eukprot:TRINITY_DN3762_c2_g1_i1.p1 TRINITY_DN3762_c2_g1~~TRINITY_DN3762_c2_g1_i1.p1  ORF type:complete len:212 (+),score=55.65 TRINITY_DN3762_c2_g1_i1:24-659(+)
MVLLRIDVLESKNGVCLFEKVWKWSGVSSSQGICSLVLTFFQISRDVGDKNGSVSEVLFEVPSTREKATAVYNQSTARRYIGASSKSKTKKEAKDQGSIKLKCGRGENFIIAIFHESFDDKSVVTDFVQKATALFKENHAKKISAMKKLFEEEDRSEEDNVIFNLNSTWILNLNYFSLKKIQTLNVAFVYPIFTLFVSIDFKLNFQVVFSS